MKVYITKYALTQGILEKEGKLVSDTMFSVNISNGSLNEFYHKPYWYTDLGEAMEHCEKMRAAKVKSLQKSLKKVQSLIF